MQETGQLLTELRPHCESPGDMLNFSRPIFGSNLMTTHSIPRRRRCGILAVGVLFAFAGAAASAATGVGVTGQGSYVTQPDPKHPGNYLWKLWARDFIIQAPDKNVSGTLKGVHAILFQDGKAAAEMIAPQAQSDNVQDTIVATGGVTVNSLKEPGTILRADAITWNAQTKQIVATGHVFYKNGKTGMTISPHGRLIADTVLRSVRSDSGGRIKIP